MADTARNIQRRAAQIVELAAALEQEAQQNRWPSVATIAKDLIVLNFQVAAQIASIDLQLATSAFAATRDEIMQAATDLGVMEQYQPARHGDGVGPPAEAEDEGEEPQGQQEPTGGETSDKPTL